MYTPRQTGVLRSVAYVLTLTFVLPVGTVFLGNYLIAAGAQFSSHAGAPATIDLRDAETLFVTCPDEIEKPEEVIL